MCQISPVKAAMNGEEAPGVIGMPTTTTTTTVIATAITEQQTQRNSRRTQRNKGVVCNHDDKAAPGSCKSITNRTNRSVFLLRRRLRRLSGWCCWWRSWWCFSLFVALRVFPPGALSEGGFTRWWVRAGLFYVLTGCRHSKLCHLIAIVGITLNAGWYSVQLRSTFVDGDKPLGHLVYRNVAGLRNYTIQGNDWNVQQLQLREGTGGLQFLSIVLDLLVHPGFCIFFWYCAFYRTTTSNSTGTAKTPSTTTTTTTTTLDEIASWFNLAAAYGITRLWSVVQNYKHHGTFSVYFLGPQVYYLPANTHRELFAAGYIGEAASLLVLILYKLYLRRPIVVDKTGVLVVATVGGGRKKKKKEV